VTEPDRSVTRTFACATARRCLIATAAADWKPSDSLKGMLTVPESAVDPADADLRTARRRRPGDQLPTELGEAMADCPAVTTGFHESGSSQSGGVHRRGAGAKAKRSRQARCGVLADQCAENPCPGCAEKAGQAHLVLAPVRVEVPVGGRYRINQTRLLLPMEGETRARPGGRGAQRQSSPAQVHIGFDGEGNLKDAVAPVDERMQRGEHVFDTSDRQLPGPSVDLSRSRFVKRWHHRA
jgi:hypothetical protein